MGLGTNRAFSAANVAGFDSPCAASGNSVVAFLSGGATETAAVNATTLDNSPRFGTARLVPGLIPVINDAIGWFRRKRRVRVISL
jgi:hypothetical protein